MFRRTFIASVALSALGGLAMADTYSGRAAQPSRVDGVTFAPVGRARTVVPVHVERPDPTGARPYALTGQGSERATRMEPIFVGSRPVGYRQVEARLYNPR